jgi:chromosome segregation ATPase
MKKLQSLMVVAVAMAFVACGGSEGKWQAEKDSIMNVNEQQRQVLDDLTTSLIEVSTSIDSIAAGENMLRDASEGPVLTKQQMLDNLAAFKNTLAENKARLAELEQKLDSKDGQLAKLNKVIKYLNGELAAKEARIAQLEEELQNANANIETMRGEIVNMNTQIGSLQNENENQRQTIESQDASLNEGYYVVGTAKELKAMGLTSGGNLFKKKKVEYTNIDKSLFTKIDIRNSSQIYIPSRKVKILTGNPTDSYSIGVNGDNTILQVHDINRFWGVSRYLIIQID